MKRSCSWNNRICTNPRCEKKCIKREKHNNNVMADRARRREEVEQRIKQFNRGRSE